MAAPPDGLFTWALLTVGIFYPLCSCDSLIWRPLCSSSYSKENGLMEKKKGIKMSFDEQRFLRKLRHPRQNILKVFFLLLQFDLFWNNRFSLLIYFFFNLSLILVEFKFKWYIFFFVPKNFTLYLSLRKKEDCLQYILPSVNANLYCVFFPSADLWKCVGIGLLY